MVPRIIVVPILCIGMTFFIEKGNNMKYLKSYEIRQMWLDFFASKKHLIVPSASLVPVDDPTLLWINAGVAPLKKYFDGREVPENPRLCNAQKSLRTNDIENVGKTARHHTFFEMLGNFSIGDYFRDEALEFANELLFDDAWFGIPRELIYITYYPADTKTYDKWVSLGVEPSHLVPISDNFWEIGEGPCGPDTEIFFDRGPKYDPNNLGIKLLQDDIENDRYIEIWNIVFSQFNSTPGLKRENYPELPSKNIDTGGGLERFACVFQGVETNYETDLFMPMINYLEELSGINYQTCNADEKMAFRVIVDHIRSVTFALADGAILSNEGRGYVLRRILRRAVRMGRKLSINKPFLYKIVHIVVENMKMFYTYLIEKETIITKLIKIEEENFLKTLESGERRLQEIMLTCENKRISGKNAFLLYDTFGFPIELTIEAASDSGFSVDTEEFKQELAAQKLRARNARSHEQSMNTQNEEFMAFKLESKFVGYDTLNTKAHVIGLFKDGKNVTNASGEVILIFDQTPFYGEMGGQIGDQGTIIYNNEVFNVLNTIVFPNGQHAHIVDMKDVVININDEASLEVDEEFRQNISCNHSATHLLNEALRRVLGSHVSQQGSLVSNDYLRFDFNNYENLTNEQILAIEKIVNDEIAKHNIVTTIETSLDEAKKLGAQAVFGEKYGKVVRLVTMGISKELCGGTHVKNTSEIEKFAILNLESKGSGIFRIEATTKDSIITLLKERLKPIINDLMILEEKRQNILEKSKNEGFDILVKEITIPKLIGSYKDIINYRNTLNEARQIVKELEKEYDNLHRNKNSQNLDEFLRKIEKINDTNVLITKVENLENEILKDIIDKIASKFDNILIFIANITNEKVVFIAKSKGNKNVCGTLVKEAALICNGNGGGRPDFAQAGGKDKTKVDDAIIRVKELIK